ncbi:hypothetical protein LZC95_02265 [Pendulispora brunnea]|uniref:SMI1/KNR4 family protein n=1 Tax=Pendulispora brunnea TaxID=2905690 RepID=A0ABZ2KAK2_9BACT
MSESQERRIKVTFETTFPTVLKSLHELKFDYARGKGIDFEPFEEFLSPIETSDWIQLWSGNDEVDGRDFRIFGRDGSGSHGAFWLAREGKPLLDQPIVFVSSEGEAGVLAASFEDYLWLLAQGYGPREAFTYQWQLLHNRPLETREPNAAFKKFAIEHAKDSEKSAAEILTTAHAEFPNFERDLQALGR